MNEIGSLLAASGAAVAAIVRYRSTRPNRLTPGQRYLLIVLCGLCSALVFDMPSVETRVATLTDLPYLARLLTNVSAMAAAFSASAMVIWTTASAYRVNGTTQVRWCAVVGALMVSFIAIVLLGTDAEFDPNFAAVIARHDEVAAGQVAFWVYMAACLGRFVAVMRRYLARVDVRPRMHQGMVMVTMASLFGVLWLVWNAFIVVVQRLGGTFSADPMEMSRSLGAATVGLVAVGLTLPRWIVHVRRGVEDWRTLQMLYRIKPLWLMLTELVPDVVGFQPEWREGLDLLLYRRVIEIRDAQLRLMNYADPDIDVLVARAEGRPLYEDWDLSSVRLSAARLASAITNYSAGRRPTPGGCPWRPEGTVTEIESEADWLAEVYVAMKSDPLVARVVHESAGNYRDSSDGRQ